MKRNLLIFLLMAANTDGFSIHHFWHILRNYNKLNKYRNFISYFWYLLNLTIPQ